MIRAILICFCLLIWGCNTPQISYIPTYETSAFSSLSANQELNTKLSTPITHQKIAGEWRLSLKGTINEFNFSNETSVVELPHRILLPNASIWYQNEISMDSGVLQIRADDGAQLWVDGVRINRIKDGYFPFDPKNNATQITIRVLNNAMEGGLHSVKWIAKTDWLAHLQLQQEIEQNWVIQQKKQYVNVKQEIDLSAPILLTEPIWQQRADTLYLRWMSEQSGKAKVHWGHDSTQLSQTINANSSSGNFIVPFSRPLQRIYYQISQDNSYSTIYSFEKKGVNDTLKFALWGDSQGGWPVFCDLLGLMESRQPAFGVGVGDLVNNGSDRMAYLQFVQALSQSSFPHYPVAGNHDYDGYYDDFYPVNYFDMVSLPGEKHYFSWQEGNCAFIALDANDRFPVGIPAGSPQYDWFQLQLQSPEWQAAEWRFVMLHHPPFSQGWPGYHGEASILKLLEPHFESAKIDFVVAGHSHDYERLIKQYGEQTTGFLIVGGGGGGIEPTGLSDYPKMDTVVKVHHYGMMHIEGKALTFEAFDSNNDLIDRIKFTH